MLVLVLALVLYTDKNFDIVSIYMLGINHLMGCKSGLKLDGRFQQLIIGPAGFKAGRSALKWDSRL